MFTLNKDIHGHETRQANHLNIPFFDKNIGKSSIRFRGAVIWNNVLKTGIKFDCSKTKIINQLKILIVNGSVTDHLYT